MENSVLLEIKKIRDTAKLPFYANIGDAGMDVCAAERVLLAPGETKAIPTGLVLNIPRGYEIQIRPRSGLSLKTRLRLPNAPGTIDSGYKDELCILIHNSSPEANPDNSYYTCTEKENRSGSYLISVGDRIAQMVLAPVSTARIQAVQEFTTNDVQNRGGGFGSSGIQ